MINMHLYLAGVRGSLPVHTAATAQFGGATTCIFVKAGGETLILDAGTGLHHDVFRTFSGASHFTMLLSHPHADHLMGFPVFPPFFDDTQCADLYLRTRGGMDARAQLMALMSPPLWPITPDNLRADIRYHDVPDAFSVGDVTVETLEVRHPGGCTAYRLTYNGIRLVYATDYEAQEDDTAFLAFARDVDLLLMDAQYTSEEYPRTRGFGHSAIPRSISVADRCGAKNTILIHHDPGRDDETLRHWNDALQSSYPSMHFGRAGEEVFL